MDQDETRQEREDNREDDYANINDQSRASIDSPDSLSLNNYVDLESIGPQTQSNSSAPYPSDTSTLPSLDMATNSRAEHLESSVVQRDGNQDVEGGTMEADATSSASQGSEIDMREVKLLVTSMCLRHIRRQQAFVPFSISITRTIDEVDVSLDAANNTNNGVCNEVGCYLVTDVNDSVQQVPVASTQSHSTDGLASGKRPQQEQDDPSSSVIGCCQIPNSSGYPPQQSITIKYHYISCHYSLVIL